jgi:hypothetical protein
MAVLMPLQPGEEGKGRMRRTGDEKSGASATPCQLLADENSSHHVQACYGFKVLFGFCGLVACGVESSVAKGGFGPRPPNCCGMCVLT